VRLSDFKNNPQAVSESLRRGVVVLILMAAAILFGYLIGTSQTRLLFLVAVSVTLLLVTVWFQTRAWMLIVAAWSITGYTLVLPLPLSMRDLSIIMAFCSFLGYQILTKRHAAVPANALEVILWVNILWLVFTYLYNPVGFWIFRSETVGARPYVNISLAVCAYYVLTRQPESPVAVSRIPFLLMIGVTALAALFMLAFFFPKLPQVMPFLFAAIDKEAFFAAAVTEREIVRPPRIGEFGELLALVLVAWYPLRAVLNPMRWPFWGVAAGAVCAALAGFRNLTVMMLAVGLLTIALKEGRGAALRCLGVAVLALVLVVLGQGRLYELPLSIQRSLAFVPGRWAPIVEHDVQASNEGRFEWWRNIVKHRLIDNWWVGDGFGARAEDLLAANARGNFEEFVYLSGGYHNGPLSAIRYTGVIGLILLYALMAITVVQGIRCCRLARGTPFLPAAALVTGYCIWIPIHYTFLFGGYDSQMPRQIFYAALIQLLTRFTLQSQPPAPPPAPRPTLAPARAAAR
jgi:hypothetical protein